jgi:hypothetical protein
MPGRSPSKKPESESLKAGDERTRRLARNEAVFRAVNEQIETFNVGVGKLADETLRVVCECGDLGCIEQLDVPLAVYENVRAEPDLFLVKLGHQAPDVEDEVERSERLVVVRKRPGAGTAMADLTDPRG